MTDRFKIVEWAHQTNIYEVNLRQYTREGTFTAFARALPRLKEMGVQSLWFMPLTPISEKNKKGALGSYYACSDYCSINPEFGTAEDFRQLVGQAHEMGMKVIIDWVANHTGWDHAWTRDHPEYYHSDPATGDFKTASGMDDIIELDFDNGDMRRAMIDAMKWWVTTFDIDGFRCDLAFWVRLDFWKQARPDLDAVKKLFWLGEFDELERPEYGEAFDASYTWAWMHAAENYYQSGTPLSALTGILKKYDDLGDWGMRAWFTSNHDENSWNGTEYEKYGDMAPALAVFSTTWNGIPLLYSGQELPLKKRLAFFDKDPIPWTGQNTLQDFYKSLLELHATHPALRGGDPEVMTVLLKTTEPQKVLAYRRSHGSREVLVIMNLSADDIPVLSFIGVKLNGTYADLFSGKDQDISENAITGLPAWGYRVLVN